MNFQRNYLIFHERKFCSKKDLKFDKNLKKNPDGCLKFINYTFLQLLILVIYFYIKIRYFKINVRHLKYFNIHYRFFKIIRWALMIILNQK